MWLNAKWFFWVIILLCIVLLAVPIFVRHNYSAGLFIGEESYRSLRIANEIKTGGDTANDELSYGGRVFLEESFWFYILSFNPKVLAMYLPAVFGLLSFILFYFILDYIKPSVKGISSLLLVISPVYIYLFSTATKYAAAAFFILLGVYLYIKDKKIFSHICFFSAGLFSVFSLLAVSTVFFLKGLRKRAFWDFVYTFAGFFILFFYYFKGVFAYGFPAVLFIIKEFTYTDFFSRLFFVFGANSGIGFFFFVLALIGAYSMFKERYFYVFVYFIFAVLLFISYYTGFLLPYLLFAFAFYAGRGFMVLLDHEWRSGMFKFLTLLVVCSGLLFNLFVFVNGIGGFYPNSEYSGAIDFLDGINIYDTVFSDYKNGEIIAYAGKKNFMDTRFAYAPGVLERAEAYDGIFSSRSYEKSELLMDKYNIKYILIDERMKNEFFEHGEDGLLFLLKNSPLRFSLVYSNSKIEIWERI